MARPEASPHGPAVPPSEAPEAITQAVASLPPEQMFELMKQMKVSIINIFVTIVLKLQEGFMACHLGLFVNKNC